MHPLILSDGSAFVERALMAAEVPFLIQQGVSFPSHRFMGDYDADGQSDVARRESEVRAAYLRDALLFDPAFSEGDYLVAGTYSVGRRRSDGRCFSVPHDGTAADRLLREVGADMCEALSAMCLMRVVKEKESGITFAFGPLSVFSGIVLRVEPVAGASRAAMPERPGPDVLDFLSWHAGVSDLADIPSVPEQADRFLKEFLGTTVMLDGIDPESCRPPT